MPETREAYVLRKRAMSARQKLERGRAERAKRMTTGEAIQLYRDEKAAWLERTAASRAALDAQCRAAVARADAEALAHRKGGRPKGSGKPKHGPGIFVPSRDKLDLLRESRPGGTP